MNTAVGICCRVILWLHLFATVCSQPLVNPMEISPIEPINGENATLKCVAGNYDPSVHDWIWQRKIHGTLIDVTANERTVFGSVQHMFSTFYSQTLTINQLIGSDEGTYLCNVVEASTGMVLSNGAGDLCVNNRNEFPVCSPEGPAVVAEGDKLSCRTLINARTLVVRATEEPSGEREDWVVVLQNATQSGSELQKIVKVEDDGLKFFCFSTSNITRKALSCTIGPLVVTSGLSVNSGLSIAAIAGIAAGGLILLLLALIHTLCCHCNPKRWLRAKSYLFNFAGIFGTAPRRNSTESAQPEVEMGHNTLDQSEAPPQSAVDDQPTLTFEGSDDENNPPVPASEPNIYVDHSVPGPSTQFVPDPTENWHEIDLKTQLDQALDDGDQSD